MVFELWEESLSTADSDTQLPFQSVCIELLIHYWRKIHPQHILAFCLVVVVEVMQKIP